MPRRVWPFLLALAAVLVFASYLMYTQRLVREIREHVATSFRIYPSVQRGLLSSDEGEALAALLEIQGILGEDDVPMVSFNRAGDINAVRKLPFEPDLATAEGQRRAKEYAAYLENRNPENKVVVEGTGTIYWGDPPTLAVLRWVPWIQGAVGGVLALVAIMMVRADMRGERERLWAAMARELAHQMGTPLSSLSGWIEVLALPHEEREALVTDGRLAEVIGADLERLERVSRRFELIGKPQALDIVRVEDVVHELEAYFQPRLPKLGKGITLRARIKDGTQPVRANRVLLVWALENVVKNAIDALGGRGGHITIVGHGGDDGRVHIHIADDGPGVPVQLRERIFEPGVSTKSGGWGVGLSLTRRIVQGLHGGKVAVRPRRRRGTVFDIALPAAGV